jgi:hypothetical protein
MMAKASVGGLSYITRTCVGDSACVLLCELGEDRAVLLGLSFASTLFSLGAPLS